MLTRYEYYNEIDWGVFEEARQRVKADADLLPYLGTIMDSFPVRTSHYYTVLKGDKADLLKFGKGKKMLTHISYKRYKQMEEGR